MSDDKSGKPDSTGKPGTDGSGTTKTLSELRAEYERATAAQSATDKGKGNDDLTALRDEVKSLRAAEADRAYRKEMDDFIVPAVLGDLKVDADLVEMWVNKQAAGNPELMTLWNERGTKAKEFKAAIKELSPEFAKYAEAKGLVQKKTEPRGQSKLQSAVRSARETTAPDKRSEIGSANLSAMSDTQFAMHSQEVFRLARAGQLT